MYLSRKYILTMTHDLYSTRINACVCIGEGGGGGGGGCYLTTQ